MIVIFSHAHPSISKGGAEVSAYTLYQGLLKLGQPAAFVAMCPAAHIGRVRFETPNEHVVAYQPGDYDHFFHFAGPAQVMQVEALVSRLQPSAMIFHHFLFLGINTIGRLATAHEVPCVMVLHEFLAICHHHGQMVTRPHKRLCESASASQCANCFPQQDAEVFHVRKHQFLDTMNRLRRLVSPSEFLAKRFEDWGLPATALAVIENGLAGYDPEATVMTVTPPASRKHPSGLLRLAGRKAAADKVAAAAKAEAARPVVFGYFGQINPFKGIDQILDAFELLKASGLHERCRIRIHGNVVGVDDNFRARFENMAAEHESIDYAGPYNNADVHRLMEECDFILMASKWWENSPVVIQEAYAARRPVIAPGFGGMAEKVANGRSGHHFKPNEPADLARVMAHCIARPRQIAREQLPRPLSARDMAQQYLALLN